MNLTSKSFEARRAVPRDSSRTVTTFVLQYGDCKLQGT